jgi:PAS domain S-box-containing protein
MLTRFRDLWESSIRHQLIAGVILVHAVVMTLLVVDMVGNQQDFLRQQSQEQALSLAETLATSSTSWVLSNDVAGLQEVIQSVTRYPELRYAMLLTRDLRVLGHNQAGNIGLYLQDATSRNLLDGLPRPKMLHVGDDVIDVAVPVMAGNRFLGWARVGLGQARIADSLRLARVHGFLFTLAALGLGSLFAVLMARWLTRRLKILAQGTLRVRYGERGFRIDIQRKDEIGRLGEDFNLMLGALETDEQRIREYQNDLKHANARLLSIIDGSPDLIAAVDTDYRYLAFNSAFAREFEKIFGKPIHQGMSLFEVLAHLPDEMENSTALWTRALEGESFSLSSEIGSARLQRNPYELSFSPMRDDSGQIIGAVQILRDITERKRMEELSRQAEMRLESTLRISQHAAESQHALLDFALNEAIALSGSKLGYIYFYDEESRLFTLHSWSREVMAECAILNPETVYELDKTGLWGEAVRQRKAIMVNNFDAPHPLKKGYPAGHAPLHRYFTIPVFSEGRIVAVVGVANKPVDYTEDDVNQLTLMMDSIWKIADRKRTEELLEKKSAELQRSNQELEQFAYIASHDLQEPLRMVSSYVQLLAKRYQGKLDADADEFIGYAVDGATRMQRLINDLLLYSRVGTRGKPFEPIDSYQALAAALDNLQLALVDSGAAVSHGPLPTVMADGSQLTQLFQNLVGNAIKFHGEAPPQVHVSARRQDKEWLFSVRDNGIGIAREDFERIFVIFQRLHGRGDYPGTGIGLAVCKRIVERHGGKIWLESEPGQGTTFLFTLPAPRAENSESGK